MFADKGVAASSVDDIVHAAGVAKGTFYLYFSTRDDVINAVAERMVDTVADRVEAAAGTPARPVERLRALGTMLRQVGTEPYERDLIEAFHRPENRAVHDRVGQRAVIRLAPAIARVIEDGIAAGEFRVRNPAHAAAFVMASLNALHEVITDMDDLATATADLDAFILGGLGYRGEARP